MTGPSNPLYSVDTSALIDWLDRYYPEENFPTLAQKVEALVMDGRFFISQEVWVEATKLDTRTKDWCTPRRDALVIPTDAAAAAAAASITAQFQGLVSPLATSVQADPFVIAVARARSATVITGEVMSRNPNRPKIPDVCTQFKIPCITFLNLIQQEGWTF